MKRMRTKLIEAAKRGDGYGCKCNAYYGGECACGADWTPSEVYKLQDQLAWLQSQVIVIEEGEEPQVGDICLWLYRDKRDLFFCTGEKMDYKGLKYNSFQRNSQSGFVWIDEGKIEIIQRICPKDNVLKPVVVRKKGEI